MALPTPLPVPTTGAPLATPGAGPSAAPVGIPGVAQLAQRGNMNGQLPQGMQGMLLFLAGIGFPEFVRSIDKMKGPQAKKGALGKEATANPAMTNPLAAQMIAKMAAMRGGPGGAPMGAPAPAPNPMAMFAR